MTKTVSQKNRDGNNIANDYVGGDKVNAIIGKIVGNNNTTHLHVITHSKIKLSEEDEKKFRNFLPEDKISEFRNLIGRIEFECELQDYEKARGFVEDANQIYHNHPILLVLHGLCEYTSKDLIEVIKNPSQISKTVKLFLKAREIDEEFGQYRGWNKGVSIHFSELLTSNVNEIRNQVAWYFNQEKYISYYKAIAKHLIHLENCTLIADDPKYVKEFVQHLCGVKGYSWFDITPSGNRIDLGTDIFEGGASGQLQKLLQIIRNYDPEFQEPEIRYANYFDDPENKSEFDKNDRKVRKIIIGLTIVITIIFAMGVWYFEMPLSNVFIFFFYPFIIWLLSHQFGSNISVFQMISKRAYKWLKK